jgi:hypothetical protein
MTHSRWNLRTKNPTSFDVRAIVWFAFLMGAALMGPAKTHAAGPTSGPLLTPPSPFSGAEDRRVEVHVRVALTNDEKLGPLNLGVRMTSGIAHLFGPVPSAEFLAHARQIVQQVPGVLEVRTSEVYFAKRRERAKPLPLPLENGKPTQTRSASPNPQSGALSSLTEREPWASMPSKQAPVLRPSLPRRTSVAVAVQPVSSAPSSINLLEPEAVMTPSRGPEPALLTAQPRTVKPAPSIPMALDRLRQRDARFRSIRTEVRGATVRIYTGDTPGEKVMAFAQAVTRLPGVERVIVQDNSLRPR